MGMFSLRSQQLGSPVFWLFSTIYVVFEAHVPLSSLLGMRTGQVAALSFLEDFSSFAQLLPPGYG